MNNIIPTENAYSFLIPLVLDSVKNSLKNVIMCLELTVFKICRNSKHKSIYNHDS